MQYIERGLGVSVLVDGLIDSLISMTRVWGQIVRNMLSKPLQMHDPNSLSLLYELHRAP